MRLQHASSASWMTIIRTSERGSRRVKNCSSITDAIRERVSFIAPVEIYAGEHELKSLAENGYNVLANKVAVHRYDKNAIVGDDQNA